jgi:DNA replication protein DnaC
VRSRLASLSFLKGQLSTGVDKRNERGSLMVTTNLPFGEWTKVFA